MTCIVQNKHERKAELMNSTPTPTPAMVALDLADVLHEHKPHVIYQLVRSVRELGTDAAYDLAARALFLDATGGVMIRKGTRCHTVGGLFFRLVKSQLDDDQHLRVFGRPRVVTTEPVPMAPEPAPTPIIDGPPCAACEQPSKVVAKFHISRAGKKYLCPSCERLGFAFTAAGDVQHLQEQAA
jgi:hypothetical protein